VLVDADRPEAAVHADVLALVRDVLAAKRPRRPR
jgi:hypothetical protein